MNNWKTLRREMILDRSPWLLVEQHEVEIDQDRVIANWPWVITPDYINIVVEMQTGGFLCFHQTKYGLPHQTLALVGGYLKPGEAPLAAARRELLEETGCVANEWIDLGHYLVDPNRGIATGNLFLARGAHVVAAPDSDDLEAQEWVLLSREELAQALHRGEFEIMAWAAAVAFALLRLEEIDADSHC